MSVTPAFLDELRSRVPLSDLIGRFVSWDQKKSQPAKGDYWAPCPFHSEKTASFHADDRKGFYYCFGCQEKGDAINFLKTKANMEFMDAVKELADMAGMQMPARDPRAQQVADTHSRLIDMHEKAAMYFQKNLSSASGVQAREYLEKKRGLSNKIIQEFGIGFVPNARDGLCIHLRELGFTDPEMFEGGLALKSDDTGKLFDRFKNRIMFPIHDPRGRVVAFGGRAMDPAARAKYLNSAESPIFHKGRMLYNLHQARNHVKGENHLIVSEGYMDVIALALAGIPTSIAPLGTAITEEQLELIWRLDPMPTIALDGDAAGQRAALRLCDLALPKIGPGKSLNFITLPSGQDPDDFIKTDGVAAFRALLKSPKPLVEMLWQQAIGDQPLETPEARADFDRRLREALAKIPDQGLREHYKANFAERRRTLFKPTSNTTNSYSGSPYGKKFTKMKQDSQSKLTALVAKSGYDDDLSVALVVKTIIAHPQIATSFMDEISHLKASDSGLEDLRRRLVLCYGDTTQIDMLDGETSSQILGKFKSIVGLKMTRKSTDSHDAEIQLRKELDRQARHKAIASEIRQIVHEIDANGATEALNKRLADAINLHESESLNSNEGDSPDNDNGNFLRQFLESESWRN